MMQRYIEPGCSQGRHQQVVHRLALLPPLDRHVAEDNREISSAIHLVQIIGVLEVLLVRSPRQRSRKLATSAREKVLALLV